MPYILKQLSAVLLIVAAIFGIYFGALKPYKKGRVYINLMRKSQNIKTIQELEKAASEAFDYPSPVGQIEQLRFFSNDKVSLIQEGRTTKEVAEELISYIEDEYKKIGGTKDYVSKAQQLVILGQLRYVTALKFVDAENMIAAGNYFEECLKLSPKRPQCLINLYPVYSSLNMNDKAQTVREEVLSYWPNESIVKQ